MKKRYILRKLLTTTCITGLFAAFAGEDGDLSSTNDSANVGVVSCLKENQDLIISMISENDSVESKLRTALNSFISYIGQHIFQFLYLLN